MRPTPTKSRPTSRSPLRSSPRRATKGKGNNPLSARRSLEDSLGSSTFAAQPVTKMQKSKRDRSPGTVKAAAAVASNINNDTPAKNRSNSGSKPKKAYGRRGRMSPRAHGAAIAKSLASPAVDSEFLMSSTAPITPSKRSTAESALHYLARNTKRGRNDGTTQSDDNNNSTLSRQQRKKRQVVNAGSGKQSVVEFIPKGKVEERWLKNFNKWKQSLENQGHDGIAINQSPIPKSWINAQRKEYKAMKENKKTSMTQTKADLLESAGFTWDAPIRRPKKNSSSSNNVDDAAADFVDEMSVSKRSSPRRSCPTQFYHNLSEKVDEKGNEKRSNSNTGEKKKDKKGEESRSSPRRSRPTQFYHNLLGKEDERGNEKRSNSNTGEKKKDKKEVELKTNKSVSNIKGGYKCSKCGQPKKGHICTEGESNEDENEDEKGIQSMALLASSSDEIDRQSTQKRQGKKRRSRGGQHKGSTLSSLETLQVPTVSSKKRKVKQADGTEIMKKAIVPSKTKNASSDATKQNRKPGNKMEVKPPTEVSENEAPVSEDQPISPFPSSPLQASNLECPESGSLSVGQAQNSPATKKIPESICIRELMMSCLTEEDREEEKRNSEIRHSELKPSAPTEGVDDEDEVTMKADEPLPNTPIQNKETPLSSFSPLSMTSPLRANNLLETSYNEEPEDAEISQPNENRGDTVSDQPAAKRKSTGTSRRSNHMIQVQPRNISTAVSAEMATQTSERVDEAKQLQLIQAEKQYQAKMAEFGKLELEAKMVTERMRQIEERMRQFESSSISNDLREYDEMKRRTSYPAETLRPSKRKMITSQRYYGSSDDDFSDEYDPHWNWRHSTHGRHGDRERSIKRRKIQPDSRRSRSKSQRSSQSKSKRSNTQRRRIEDSMVEDDRDRSSVSRKHRKKGNRKKTHEAVQHSASQVDQIALKSPYAVLRSDEGKPRDTRQPDESFEVENFATTAEMEENDTATSAESEKMPGKAREQNKKDSDSSSTKQSSIERAENRNDASHTHKTQNEDSTKAPLYWLAGGESDSDEESWDFDGPMILPPPPA